MTRRAVVCGLVLALLAAAGAPRTGNTAPIAAIYNAYWAGFQAARIRLEIGGSGDRYRDAIAISSEGLPRLVTRFRGTATAEGSFGRNRLAEPSRYDAVYDLRKRRNSHISMRFVARDGARIAERGPADTSRKPPLAAVFRRDAVDPLSACERIRQALRAALDAGQQSFTVPVYDGARRFDVLGRVLPKAGSGERIVTVALTLRPIAGFKGESSDDGDPDNAPRPARLTFSDDARLLPLSVEVRVLYLPLVVRLDHFCPAASACRL